MLQNFRNSSRSSTFSPFTVLSEVELVLASPSMVFHSFDFFFCECVMIFLCLNSLAFVVLFLLNEDGIFEARFSENMTERGFLISSVGLQSNVPPFNRGSDSIDREAMWSNCEDSYRNYAFVKLRKMQSFYIPNLSLYVFYVFVHLFP